MNSSQEKTPTKIEHVIPAQMQPAEKGPSAEKQLKIQNQTHAPRSQQSSDGEQYSAQHSGKKDIEVIIETHPSSQRSSSMCAILKPNIDVA